ncbi:WD repeat, SAM and U-box domain-containing protein 1 isoform X2 [Anguilla anguilla]|uniref:WD repeat, SAM and U-box domain-containing protein 1 isoform X2 n=1 Tax=Anguilla anguilla TaxID=7936 RepID=UPI0015A7F3B6|nr:WD repeat, SAM and U-box domain-containing protein 1 isoform X2 [Anguilla anguilla]
MVSLICTIRDHRDDINWCAFSPKLLATCSSDKTIRVYFTQDFSELAFSPLTGHGYGVHCCCFSPCGKFLASCSTDATTVVWSMDTGDLVTVFEHPGRSPVRVCVFSPDSSLISGASDGTLALWDLPSKTLRRTGASNEASIVACSFTPCGQMFATGSTYGDIRVWDLELNPLHTVKNAHDLGVTCCQFAPKLQNDGCLSRLRLASCGQDSQLKIWMLSRQAAAGCKLQLLHTLVGQTAPVLSCAFSADAQLLVSGSVDKTITVYGADQGVLLYRLHQHERYVTACAFSATAPCLIATGSMDKTVNIWRVEDGIDRTCGTLLLSLHPPNTVTDGQSSPHYTLQPQLQAIKALLTTPSNHSYRQSKLFSLHPPTTVTGSQRSSHYTLQPQLQAIKALLTTPSNHSYRQSKLFSLHPPTTVTGTQSSSHYTLQPQLQALKALLTTPSNHSHRQSKLFSLHPPTTVTGSQSSSHYTLQPQSQAVKALLTTPSNHSYRQSKLYSSHHNLQASMVTTDSPCNSKLLSVHMRTCEQLAI